MNGYLLSLVYRGLDDVKTDEEKIAFLKNRINVLVDLINDQNERIKERDKKIKKYESEKGTKDVL